MSGIIKSYKQASSEEKVYMSGRLTGEIQSMITPWSRLNRAGIDGLEWGTVNLIGAMSGVGKTALVNNLVFAVHDLNPTQTICVLFFTVEMAARRLIARMISFEMRIPVKELYHVDAEMHQRINEVIIPKHEGLDIRYVEKMFSVRKIVEIIQAFCEKRLDKQCLIVYDHSLLIRRKPGESERETIVDFGMELLMLKKQFPNSMYIVLSQLNRSIETTERIKNKTLHFPMKSDIFGSDGLWHASDVVMVMHDPSRLNIRNYGPKDYPTDGLLFAHLLKVREGKPGIFIVKNESKFNRFPELSRSQLTQMGFDIKPKTS